MRMAEQDEDKGGANSEMRYITLELMKLAARKKLPFRKIASEFVENAYSLAELLQDVPKSQERKAKGGKGAASNQEEND